jgi:hypothetical protein
MRSMLGGRLDGSWKQSYDDRASTCVHHCASNNTCDHAKSMRFNADVFLT